MALFEVRSTNLSCFLCLLRFCGGGVKQFNQRLTKHLLSSRSPSEALSLTKHLLSSRSPSEALGFRKHWHASRSPSEALSSAIMALTRASASVTSFFEGRSTFLPCVFCFSCGGGVYQNAPVNIRNNRINGNIMCRSLNKTNFIMAPINT